MAFLDFFGSSWDFSFSGLVTDELAAAAVQLLPIWIFGAIVGLLVSTAVGAPYMHSCRLHTSLNSSDLVSLVCAAAQAEMDVRQDVDSGHVSYSVQDTAGHTCCFDSEVGASICRGPQQWVETATCTLCYAFHVFRWHSI